MFHKRIQCARGSLECMAEQAASMKAPAMSTAGGGKKKENVELREV